MKICYIMGRHISFQRAGQAYMDILAAAGVTLVPEPNDADIVIIHDEPLALLDYFRAYPEIRKKYIIAYSVWEPSILNADRRRWLSMVSEVWTPSSFAAHIFSELAIPVTVIPHVVAPPRATAEDEALMRRRLGLADGTFIFYTIARWEPRKNLEAAVKAFEAAFPSKEACYVIKTNGPVPADLASRSGIVCINEHISDASLAALHGVGHCCVSAHCAEAWGLCLSEAMALGNLVVATGYSGNMEFMDSRSALLVDFNLEPIRETTTRLAFGFPATSAQAQWAYVDEAHLARTLRRAYDDWDSLAGMRAQAQDAVRPFAADLVARRMLQRLEEI